jgi:uridine kinase
VRPLLDAVWFVAADDALRLERLISRHIEFGKPPDVARAWATGTDQRNARVVEATRGRADLLVRLD